MTPSLESKNAQKESIQNLIATNLLHAFGFFASSESLPKSILTGVETLGLGGFPNNHRLSKWENIDVRYHFEEALIVRAFIVEMEMRSQLVTNVILTTRNQLKYFSDEISAADVMKSMSVLVLPIARERASIAGSTTTLSNEEATAIHNSRSAQYGPLVRASVLCTEPTPLSDFQLGIPRNHPSTDLLVCSAENLCHALKIDVTDQNGDGPVLGLMLELAVWKKYIWAMKNSRPET